MAGSILLRSLRNRTALAPVSYYTSRCITSNFPRKKQAKPSNHMPPKKSWLTRRVEESPMWRALFFQITNLLGYGSPKQMAGRHSFILYDKICAVKPDEDRAFWQDGKLCNCHSSFGAKVMFSRPPPQSIASY